MPIRLIRGLCRRVHSRAPLPFAGLMGLLGGLLWLGHFEEAVAVLVAFQIIKL